MWLYSIIMFLVSFLLLVISICIYRGITDLIHDYHQTKVNDRVAYGKAFGVALFIVALAPLVSGIMTLVGREDIVLFAVMVLMVGIIIGIACIVLVQKKYNNGIF